MSVEAQQSLFGAVSMGYALIESERLGDWRRFTEKGLGLHLECASESLLAFRMDRHQRRLIVCKGPAEDVAAVGWQLRDEAALNNLLGRLHERDIPVEKGRDSEAALRGVMSFWRLKGPKGLSIELFTQPLTTDAQDAEQWICHRRRRHGPCRHHLAPPGKNAALLAGVV